MGYEDRKIITSKKNILNQWEQLKLSQLLLDLEVDGIDPEDTTLEMHYENCYCYSDNCGCKKWKLQLTTERLETDAEYEKRVRTYLEKLARKNDPERKKKLAEKREQNIKQKQEEQRKKDLALLLELQKKYPSLKQ